MRRVLALIAVLALLPAAAARAADPFGATPSNVAPTQSQTPATTVVSSSGTSSNASAGGMSGSAKTALLIGAITLIGGIAFVIVRDARRSTPRHRHASATSGAHGGAHGDAAARPLAPPPGARGRHTGKASAERRRKAKRRR